ncbi:inner centromere protein A isoform X2 [Euwallacea similis]|uniref:inner centromere protein A isoform X2 n=1 Tax=Euwallacea similis TaxID=1736056 RepID=UPI00344BB1D0
MSNRALEMVLREVDAIAVGFNDCSKLLEQIKDLEKEQVAFFKSVDKFSKTGDLKQLEPYLKGCNLEGLSSKQSDRYSRNGTILSETSQENFTYFKTKKAEVSECQVGKENIKIKSEDMPAPSWVPPLKKKVKTERPSRSTRSKSKLARDSDVILQQPEVVIIDLSDVEDTNAPMTRTTRSTRTKARKEAETAVEPEVEPVRNTRTKTRAKKEPEVKPVEVEQTRTRTKTIRKAKNNEPPPTEEEQPENIARNTRTKTIRKAPADVPPSKEAATEEPDKETKTIRTKTEQKAENAVPLPQQRVLTKRIIEKPAEVQPKRNRSSEDDEIAVETKKNKSDSPFLQADTSAQSVYNDAISNPASLALDATYVAVKSTATAANTAAVNSNSKDDQNMFNIFGNSPESNLLTDDESIEIKTPPKQTKTTTTSKEVFSPYEKTTLKKKVEAFERLQHGSVIPLKQGVSHIPCNPGSSIKEKSKAFTPQSKFLPLSSSTSKVTKILGMSSMSSMSGTASALKSRNSQKDPREQLKRQLDREQANKKKEAMLQQQAELKRKQNKEKHLKALQQRKALEAEKMRHLELQKQKDEEKRKQIEQDRELNYLKYKQEQEKKHQLQKMRLMQVQKQADGESQKLPVYMTSKVPCLVNNPAADDSTEEVSPPRWCRGDYLRHLEVKALAGGYKLKNTLFGRRPRTADLVDIFEIIDAGKLKRNSSAIWKKPPRYTMMNLNDTQFSEDDEVFSD